MELYEVTLSGYRKFRNSSRLKTSGKLVSILGPNEAGKSSLLAAMERLNDSDPFSSDELSHDLIGDEISIQGRFLLSEDDKVDANVPDAIWYTIEKKSDGKRFWNILPRPPGRDLSVRVRLFEKAISLSGKPKFRQQILESDADLIEELQETLSEIKEAGEDLTDTQIASLTSLKARVVTLSENGFPAYALPLIELFEITLASEKAENSRKTAGNKLWDRLPRFLLFGIEDRNLKSSYAVSELRVNVPRALSNLMEVAQCDLEELLKIYGADDVAKVDTIVDRANENLEKNFKAVWKQSAISVVISVKDQQLYVQVRNADKRRTSFSERSDGLRQFVALQCFMTARGESDPILLIDEAEQHLHYDAQADLIQMLVAQTAATKVIYTTHSAGCLPEDLGNGVRLVEPEGKGEEWSRVKNKFWDSKQSTLSPLLIGMGASTLAFFPMRVAVVVEGEADMLLYPTMIRDALGSSTSGMQFVPGLSRIDKQQLPMLNTVGTQVCFLVDDDPGGRTLISDLTRMGIQEDRIFKLSRPGKGDVELEDLIDSEVLAIAVNELTRRHHQNGEVVRAAQLPKYAKWDFVVARCADQGIPPLLKVDVAYEILDQIASEPTRRLLDNRLRENLKQVALAIRAKLQLEP